MLRSCRVCRPLLCRKTRTIFARARANTNFTIKRIASAYGIRLNSFMAAKNEEKLRPKRISKTVVVGSVNSSAGLQITYESDTVFPGDVSMWPININHREKIFRSYADSSANRSMYFYVTIFRVIIYNSPQSYCETR